MTTIKLKRSATSGSVPSASDLEQGEVAINTADGRLFMKHTDDSIVEIEGEKGEKGQTGSTGDQGAKGQKGEVGDQGASGNDGAKGDKGEKGAVGADGSDGAKGQKGDQGVAGNDGSSGSDGDKGQKGEQGAAGNDGSNGSDGAKGEKGQKGQVGADGADGSDGAKGQKGEKGQTGSAGSDGSDGAKGQKGEKGQTGSAGSDGSDGSKGEKGQKGQTGQKGQQGNFGGQTFSYQFNTATTDSDPTSGKLLFNNATPSSANRINIDDADGGGTDIQSYLRTIDDSTSTIKGHVRISNSTDADDFVIYTISGLSEQSGYFRLVVSYIDGDATFSNNESLTVTFARTGDTGDKGQKGEGGTSGNDGAKGEKGQKGQTGATGSDGTDGDKGQKGQTGAAGANGSDGSDGAKGQKGDKGQTGSAGTDGNDGAKGQKGEKGQTGASGSNGSDGAKGQKGDKGQTGSTGSSGSDGAKGEKGEKGQAGTNGSNGAKGQKGEKGQKGQTGSAGSNGSKGQKGEKGQKGQTGSGGATGSKGQKGEKGQKGVEGSSNAHLDLAITSNMSLDSTQNKVSKTTDDNSWNGEVRSTVGYRSGAYVSFAPNQTNKYFMMGLSDDPTSNTSHTSIDYNFYCVNDGSLRIYEAGTNVGTFGTYSAGTKLVITYDNDKIRYFKDGALQRTVDVAADRLFYLDSSFYDTGNDQTQFINFGPMGGVGTKGQKGEKGQKGQAGTNGSNGAKGQKGEKGQKGATGAGGSTGAKGQKGQKGQTGSTGSGGAKGQKGEKGQKGQTGAGGSTGSKGQKGQKGEPNTINYSDTRNWTESSGSQSGYGLGGTFNQNGDGNSCIYALDPYDRRALVWRTLNNDASSDADGGWNQDISGLSDSKSYMSVVFVKRVGSTTSGSFYHGCHGSHTLNLNGAANTNPYFSSFGISVLPQDVWCVSIGIIQSNDDTNTTNSQAGGLYRLDTGAKVQGYSTFKMKSGSTAQRHRTYLYYSTNANSQLQWWGAGFYEINGNEPNLDVLTGGLKGQKGQTGGTGGTGAKGQKGQAGSNGSDGAKGQKGQTGSTGSKGQKGEQGPSAVTSSSITIGSGVTLAESTDRADLLQITSSTSGWGGLQIRNSSNEGRWSFMTDGGQAGIYDDENGDWFIYMNENSYTQIRHNNAAQFQTNTGGVAVSGLNVGGTSNGNPHNSNGIQVNMGTDEKIVLSGSNQPYIRWQEGTTDKAYVQWNTDGYLLFGNQESGNWRFRSADVTTAIKLRFEASDGDVYGSIYADHSNNVGFLDDDEHWAYRISTDSQHEWRINNTIEMSLSTSQLDLKGNNIVEVEDMGLRDRIYHDDDTNTYIQFHAADQWRVVTGGTERFEVNNTNSTVQNNLIVNGTATFNGTVSGVNAAARNGYFWENDQTITSNQTITNNKNAMSAGPITINNNITVTIGDGEAWSIV